MAVYYIVVNAIKQKIKIMNYGQPPNDPLPPLIHNILS